MVTLGQRARALIDRFVDYFRSKTPRREPKFRHMAKLYEPSLLAENEGTKLLRKRGFTHFINVRGTIYVQKNGTNYRLDRLQLA